MSYSTQIYATPRSVANPVVATIVVGLVASIVMAMWQMIVEAILSGGVGFFGPPIAIGATVVRNLQGATLPLPLDWTAFVLGLVGHMMNSVILSIPFAFVAMRREYGLVPLVVIGMVWSVIVFAVMWYVVAPALDPLVHTLNGPVFFVGHLMWGAAVGVVWWLFESRQQPLRARA